LSSPQSTSTYIGFTTHPVRRLRQHNGEIKCGAVKTSKKRPWSHVLIISGFPNKITALQFEWQFQHPTISRVARDILTCNTSKRGYKAKIHILIDLLSTKLWKQIDLTVHFIDPEAYSYFKSLKQQIIEQYCFDKVETFTLIPSLSTNISISSCSICNTIGGVMWTCLDCSTRSHLICTAKNHIDKSNLLVPTSGECKSCGRIYNWIEIVRCVRIDKDIPSGESSSSDTSSDNNSEMVKSVNNTNTIQSNTNNSNNNTSTNLNTKAIHTIEIDSDDDDVQFVYSHSISSSSSSSSSSRYDYSDDCYSNDSIDSVIRM
jgi:predicted GIY-YIG superfamily endonuclease